MGPTVVKSHLLTATTTMGRPLASSLVVPNSNNYLTQGATIDDGNHVFTACLVKSSQAMT